MIRAHWRPTHGILPFSSDKINRVNSAPKSVRLVFREKKKTTYLYFTDPSTPNYFSTRLRSQRTCYTYIIRHVFRRYDVCLFTGTYRRTRAIIIIIIITLTRGPHADRQPCTLRASDPVWFSTFWGLVQSDLEYYLVHYVIIVYYVYLPCIFCKTI